VVTKEGSVNEPQDQYLRDFFLERKNFTRNKAWVAAK
jgi:hypothetical protein